MVKIHSFTQHFRTKFVYKTQRKEVFRRTANVMTWAVILVIYSGIGSRS